MTISSIFYDTTLLLLLTTVGFLTIKQAPLYFKTRRWINSFPSRRLLFRIILCLILLFFCSENLSESSFFCPLIALILGSTLWKERWYEQLICCFVRYRKTVLCLYLMAFATMFFFKMEGLSLLYIICILETSSFLYDSK